MAQVAVAPGPIAKDFDVVEDASPGQIPGFVDPFADAFLFQAAEERFSDRIIRNVYQSGGSPIIGQKCLPDWGKAIERLASV